MAPPAVSVPGSPQTGWEGPLHPRWPPHPDPPLSPLPDQNVVYPVRIESSSDSLANGRTLDLNCLVASQAPHTITWYKRGGSLPSRHQVWSQRAERVHARGRGWPPWEPGGAPHSPPLCSFSHSTHKERSCQRGPGQCWGHREESHWPAWVQHRTFCDSLTPGPSPRTCSRPRPTPATENSKGMRPGMPAGSSKTNGQGRCAV